MTQRIPTALTDAEGGAPPEAFATPGALALDRFRARIRIAYFTMELAIRPEMKTYSGGLGMLAGDTARTAADLGLPMAFVSLVSRQGYVRQGFDPSGRQTDAPDPWDPADWAVPLNASVAVDIEGRPVWIRAWLHAIACRVGGVVPVLLLDSDVPGNHPDDRAITNRLYGGDAAMRLKQEAVLGIGGERMLRALGFDITTYHLNEGHAALLTLSLLRRRPRRIERLDGDFPYDRDAVVERCIFTTHTPVKAGHDRFDYDLVRRVVGGFMDEAIVRRLAGEEALDMTQLALNLCGYVNGVARRHGETTARMFPGYPIRAITNGVHPATWVHPALARLYDQLDPYWRHEAEMLSRADTLPDEALRAAHAEAKAELLAVVRENGGQGFDPNLPILAVARRMTGYKRPDLLVADRARLVAIARRLPFQVVFAGKAHPNDDGGKDLIARLHAEMRHLAPDIPMTYLPNYDFAVARPLVAGADVWLNTPEPPLEASGTSGMKAALNGVPSLSVLDGWWVEGCVEGVTGWAVGAEGDPPTAHAAALLDKLERVVLPLYHGDQAGWTRLMKGAIANAGAVFTSHRMMRRYAAEAYLGRG